MYLGYMRQTLIETLMHRQKKTSLAEVLLVQEERLSFLPAGGLSGGLIREIDWSKTALGPVDGWPQSLRTSISICFEFRFPMLIWWGPSLVKFYNDAYIPMLGAKHPRALDSRDGRYGPRSGTSLGRCLKE